MLLKDFERMVKGQITACFEGAKENPNDEEFYTGSISGIKMLYMSTALIEYNLNVDEVDTRIATMIKEAENAIN